MLLPYLLAELREFGQTSNFREKYTKSQILPITVYLTNVTNLKQDFSFSWSSRHLKNLGMQLIDHFGHLYFQNYDPLFRTICRDLNAWHKDGSHQHPAGNHILSRVLFYLQLIPVALLKSFFSQIQSVFIHIA